MASNFGDNTTIVEDERDTSYATGKDRLLNGKPSLSSRGTDHKRKPTLPGALAATAVDYLQEERPFFIMIEKDGPTGALEKLDQQLRAVSAFTTTTELCEPWGPVSLRVLDSLADRIFSQRRLVHITSNRM